VKLTRILRPFIFPVGSVPELDFNKFLDRRSQLPYVEEFALNSEESSTWGHQVVQPHPTTLVVFIHGNGERLEENIVLLEHYHRLGCHFLAVEYRGYGRAVGVPSANGILDDYTEAINNFIKKNSSLVKTLVFHGKSLGGGLVCQLARRIKPDGLILESSFTKLSVVSALRYIPDTLFENTMDSLSFVSTFRGAYLQIHGSKDQMIPIKHGETLYSSCLSAQKKFVRVSAGHGDILLKTSEPYLTGIASFLKEFGFLSPTITQALST
jgi:fermentation-respiration switch protein FrsA (DUF1100 family)